MNKLIKTPGDHAEALRRLDELMALNPDAGTVSADELELLAHLIEDYERKHHDLGMPDPLEAIRFRMEQQGLKPKDMIAYLGVPSKVSEILNAKRPLTLAMIRRLHEGLGIPVEVLIAERASRLPREIPVEKFPLKVIKKR